MILYSNYEAKLLVRTTEKKDLDVLAEQMSKGNIEELWVAHHITPEECLEMAFIDSDKIFTIELDSEPIAIFGTRNITEYSAEIYMLVTENFYKIGRIFLRHAREIIKKFLNFYPYLDGWVYTKNEQSILWMKYCGFTIETPMPYGIEQKLFSHFFII